MRAAILFKHVGSCSIIILIYASYIICILKLR